MPRIRSIKPEFWSDSRLARDLTRDQRLFYIALWNEADDEGRFLAHPRRLLGAVFPYDEDLTEDSVRDSLRALATTGRLVLYIIDGEPYGQLIKFSEHQYINRPTPSKLPAPPDVSSLTEHSLSDHGGFTAASLPAREEQGTGNRDLEAERDTDAEASFSTSEDPKIERARQRHRAIEEVFDHWQQVSGKDRATLTADRKAKIKARLKRFTIEELKRAIDGAHENPFYLGDNDRHQYYGDLTTIFKSDSAVEKHRDYEGSNGAGGGSHAGISLNPDFER